MRVLRWLIGAVLVACVAVFLVYRAKDPERRPLDDAARAEAPGSFVQLADGGTHYEAAGPDSGRTVVLAAGFSVPGYIWDSLYQGLADSGFRVIRYDYYGRGWSDRPSTEYDQDLFLTGRPLPPEERSAWAWNVHMVFRGGSEEMASGQRFDFLHPREPQANPRRDRGRSPSGRAAEENREQRPAGSDRMGT